MASTDVPKILIPALFRLSAIFRGVCPPSCTITPKTSPFSFYLLMMDKTSSCVSGSKYNLSEVS